MGSQEDKENELRRREQELHERETAMRLRELEDELSLKQPPLYQTKKHQSESSGKLLYKKLILAGKFFALAVATIVCVKLATWLAGIIIIGGLALFAYKLFFDSGNTK